MTRVFAMPYNGQCLNVGRVEDSQRSLNSVKDAKGGDCTKKMKPRFRGRDLGFAYW